MASPVSNETEFEVKTFMDQFENFLTVTVEARTNSERDVDYVHHKQWTQEELDVLAARNQPPVVINRIKTKTNLLTGIQRSRRTDPKALPRTPVHERDADSITDALRYVADNNDFDMTSSAVFENITGWGYGGCITRVVPKGDSFEIRIENIPPDRFYFDPHSRRLDFKDAKYFGIVVWMDADDGKDLFPDHAEDIDALFESDFAEGSSFEDRPLWVDSKRKRFRLCQHYFRKGNEWYVTFFAGQIFLKEPKLSEYLDYEDDPRGLPGCPIEAQAAYIDRDNNRYGEVRAYIWAQDEVNHRRSRALHNLSTRQTMGDEGVVDVNDMKAELAKANGHVILKGGPNRRFEILDNTDVTQGQLALYQDAKGDIDAIGANAALSGKTNDQDLSGRAIQALQQGGIAELGQLFDGHSYWEKRVYRQVWYRVKQYWNEQRWVRVTDREDNLRWVTLNEQITVGQKLQEAAKEGDQQAQKTLQQMMAQQDQRLNEVAEVRNNTTELDVDIIISSSPDFATLRHEQFEAMAQLAKSYGPEAVPFEVMLKLSDMSHKDEIAELLHPPEQEEDPVKVQARQEMQEELMSLQFRNTAAETDLAELQPEALKAKIQKDLADAEAQALENEFVRSKGVTPQVAAQVEIAEKRSAKTS